MCSNQALHTQKAAREHGTVAASAQARKANGALSPTFRLFGGTIETLPASLKGLNSHRADIEQAARSVGRIHQGPVTLGTGFVIGPNVIMTARHVAQSFATDVDGVLKIRIGWTPAIDFLNANTYGGCYYPRFNRVSGALGFLSRQSWGMALDTNTTTNAQGTTPRMDCRVVRIFRKHKVEEYIVENDTPDVTPLTTAAVGHVYLDHVDF